VKEHNSIERTDCKYYMLYYNGICDNVIKD
jgi:hypothetical protein